MTLQFSPLQSTEQSFLEQQLPMLLSTVRPKEVTKTAAGSGAKISDSYPVYAMGLNNLGTTFPSLKNARLASKRFLVLEQSECYTVDADIDLVSNGSIYGITAGPFPAATLHAIALAEESDAVKNSELDFEVRLLLVPALHVAALWLHNAQKPGTDLLTPLMEKNKIFENNKWYTESDFLSRLTEPAARALKWEEQSR